MEYNRAQGRTLLLNGYQVEQQGDDWAVYHYVGGEDYETTYDWYATKEEAEQVCRYLNTTCPPEAYTHFYIVE
jgi:hypothetical protein